MLHAVKGCHLNIMIGFNFDKVLACVSDHRKKNPKRPRLVSLIAITESVMMTVRLTCGYKLLPNFAEKMNMCRFFYPPCTGLQNDKT